MVTVKSSQEELEPKQFTLWKNSNFIYLWFSYIVSNFGYQIYLIVLPLLIYEMTNSAFAMSAMRAIDFLPNIFIGLIIGVIVDRVERKWLITLTTIVRIIALLLIILLISKNNLEVWHLYILGFVLSSAGFAFGNCYHSVIPQIVSTNQLTEANAKTAFSDTLVNLLGPGIAGVLIATYSFQISFVSYLFCLFVMIILIQLINVPKNNSVLKEHKSSFFQDLKEGIVCLWDNKDLLTPTIAIVFSNFAASLVIGVLVFYAADILGATEKQIGLMYSMAAIGGVLGSILITRLRNRFGRGKTYLLGIALEIISMVILIFSFSWWLISLSMIIRYFAVTVSNVVYFTIRQEITPNHLLGRVFGTTSMIMKLALPAGLFVSGIWAEFLPIKGLFIISTVILTILFICISRHPFSKVR